MQQRRGGSCRGIGGLVLAGALAVAVACSSSPTKQPAPAAGPASTDSSEAPGQTLPERCGVVDGWAIVLLNAEQQAATASEADKQALLKTVNEATAAAKREAPDVAPSIDVRANLRVKLLGGTAPTDQDLAADREAYNAIDAWTARNCR